MPVPQFCDVDQETVPPDRCEEIALHVADLVVVVMIALGLVFLVSGASRCYFGSCNVLLPDSFITDYLALIGIPCAVLVVITQCIKNRRAASRTGVNGDNHNIGGVAEVLDDDFLEACPDDGASLDNDGSGERPMVQPPRQLIPSSSSISMTAGGVSAGSGAVTAAYVELARVLDHRRRSERERGVDMPGEAVRDTGRGKNA